MSEYSVAFNQWWNHYPAYKRKGKGAAWKVWERDKLDGKVGELIENIDSQVENDEHFQKYTPLPATYLNQRRYDDYVPKPKPVVPTRQYVEDEGETDPYVKAVKRVAMNWLWRRRGIPEDRVEVLRGLIHTLADDARELHGQDRLTDAYAQTIRDELDAMVKRGARNA